MILSQAPAARPPEAGWTTATGIAADGGREVLGVDVGDLEDEVFWRAFLTNVKKRGLGGIRLVIPDQHAGRFPKIGTLMDNAKTEVPAFPAAIRLVGAILADMHDEWQSGERRSRSEGSLAPTQPDQRY